MIVAIHRKEGKILAAVCDSELLGKSYSEGNRQLDLSSGFYAGEEKNATETGDIIRNADYANLVGKEAVALGLKEGVVDQEVVRYINSIPFAESAVLH